MRKHTVVGAAAALTVIAVAGCGGAPAPRAVPTSSPLSHRVVPAVATLVPPCLDRVNRWFNAGGSAELKAVADDAGIVGTDANNYAADRSAGDDIGTDLSALGTAAGILAADTSAALTDPPPGCVPAMAGDYEQAMRDLDHGAALFTQGVSGLVEVDRGNGYLDKATTAFTNYEAG